MQTSGKPMAVVAMMAAVMLVAAGCSKSVQSESGSKGFEQPPVQSKSETGSTAESAGGSAKAAPEKAPREDFAFPRGGQETPQVGSLPAETTTSPESKSGDVRVSEGVAVAKAAPSDGMQDQGGQLSAAQTGLMDVFFAFDSWKLTEDGKQALTRDADWLKANGQHKLTIEGYCDERGTQAYNLVLGQKRAKTVQGYLAELGIPASRMAVISYGKDRPFCREQTEDCYQQNRRGHLVVGGK
jgi:peptidoglycan-associated lipoprotein